MHPLGLTFETPEPVFAGTGVSFIRDFFTVHFILNCKKLHQFTEQSFQILHTGIFWISRCAGIGMCGFCKEL